jgi:hypothetical protein
MPDMTAHGLIWLAGRVDCPVCAASVNEFCQGTPYVEKGLDAHEARFRKAASLPEEMFECLDLMWVYERIHKHQYVGGQTGRSKADRYVAYMIDEYFRSTNPGYPKL